MRRRALLAGLVVTPALAQETVSGGWPARSVELVVPYAAGGPTDRYAREFAPRLGERWGQQVGVSNKPGGATAIGTAAVADRKSTRLNSSHANISYAVFCLKKTPIVIL